MWSSMRSIKSWVLDQPVNPNTLTMPRGQSGSGSFWPGRTDLAHEGVEVIQSYIYYRQALPERTRADHCQILPHFEVGRRMPSPGTHYGHSVSPATAYHSRQIISASRGGFRPPLGRHHLSSHLPATRPQTTELWSAMIPARFTVSGGVKPRSIRPRTARLAVVLSLSAPRLVTQIPASPCFPAIDRAE